MSEEDIKKLAAALKGGDRDSFASFTSGLRSNWVFIIAVFAMATWIFNSFTGQTTTNLQQDARIDTLTSNVAQLTSTVGGLASQVDGDNKTQNEIQQDIALIKADINTIKETIKR